ncbi:MAG: hypothetical protein ACE5GA_10335 [Candidatus Zixiibacteriota bacterium]
MKRFLIAVGLFGACVALAIAAISAEAKKQTSASSKKEAVESKEHTPVKSGAATSGKVDKKDAKKVTSSAAKEAEIDALLKKYGTSLEEVKTQIHTPQRAAGAPAAGEQINWQVLSGGGGVGTSTNFSLISVVGQTAVGMGSSTNFNVNHGFLQDFGGGGCCDTPGDFNDDGSYNIGDVTAGIAFIFSGGPGPVCPQEGDFNGDGTFNIADVTAGIAFIFSGGAAPICGP